MSTTDDKKVIRAVFDRPLKLGSTGHDVKKLQTFLNGHGFFVAQSGPGSQGQETTFFDQDTESALTRFQKAYSEDILKLNGIAAEYGHLDPSTMGQINSMFTQDDSPPPSAQKIWARIIGTSLVLVSGLLLVVWYLNIRFFSEQIVNPVFVGNITFYFFVIFYVLILFVFIRNMNLWTDSEMWTRVVVLGVFLLCIFFCIANGDIFSRYITSTQNTEVGLQRQTAVWRNQHCSAVADPDNTCSYLAPQKYQCDDGSAYCSQF